MMICVPFLVAITCALPGLYGNEAIPFILGQVDVDTSNRGWKAAPTIAALTAQ
jgi:hypothetical protein